jgi:hypothetical protein
MKLLADVHISPRTVTFLRGLGHDVVRVGPDYLRSTASDADIVAAAIVDKRIIVTQDVDFSAIVATTGCRSREIARTPSGLICPGRPGTAPGAAYFRAPGVTRAPGPAILAP